MREIYQDHMKVIVVGGVVLAIVAAFFIGGTMFGTSNETIFQTRGIGGGAALDLADEGVFAESSMMNKGMIIQPPELPSVQPGDISDKKVIKNAHLSLVVKKIEEAISAIKSITEGTGGFVENSSVYETGDDRKGGNITVRVPSDTFDASVDEIKGVAIKVSREDVNARDVTEQFVDMEARLKNMKAEEQQYLDIMKRAVKIEDVLNVAKSLADVRGRIERLEGQLNYLSRQVDMSTISISLTAEADVEVFGIVWSPLAEIKQGVRDMLQSIVNFINAIIAFMFKLPVLMLWLALALLVGWGGWKGVLIIKRKIVNKSENTY